MWSHSTCDLAALRLTGCCCCKCGPSCLCASCQQEQAHGAQCHCAALLPSPGHGSQARSCWLCWPYPEYTSVKFRVPQLGLMLLTQTERPLMLRLVSVSVCHRRACCSCSALAVDSRCQRQPGEQWTVSVAGCTECCVSSCRTRKSEGPMNASAEHGWKDSQFTLCHTPPVPALFCMCQSASVLASLPALLDPQPSQAQGPPWHACTVQALHHSTT